MSRLGFKISVFLLSFFFISSPGIAMAGGELVIKRLNHYDAEVFVHQKFNAAQSLKDILEERGISNPERAYALLILSELYRKRELRDSAFYFGKKCVRLSQRHSLDSTECRAHIVLSLMYSDEGKFDVAIDHGFASRALALKNNYYRYAAVACIALGKAIGYAGDSKGAIQYFGETLKFDEKDHVDKTRARALNNIADALLDKGEYKLALKFLHEALKVLAHNPDIQFRVYILENLGRAYIELKNYPMATDYLQQALHLSDSILFVDGKSVVLARLGQLAFVKKDYSIALERYQAALSYGEKLGIGRVYCDILNRIGVIYDSLKDDTRATELYTKSYKIAAQLGAGLQWMEALAGLARLAEKKKNVALALDYQKQLNRLVQEQLANERRSQNAVLETQLLVQKKQNEASLLRTENEMRSKELQSSKIVRIVMQLLIFALVAFLMVGFWSFLKVKKTRNELMTKNQKIELQNQQIQQSYQQLKMMQEKLLQQEKQASLGLLTAGIAHELNNPMNFINGGVQVLEDLFSSFSPADTFQQAKDKIDLNMQTIREGVERCTKIIDGLRIFSSPQSDEFLVTSLAQSVRLALTIINSKLKQNDIRSNVQIPEDLMVFANPSRLSQLFINFIDNAVDAMATRQVAFRRLEIRGEANHDKAIVYISDTGGGIPEPIRGRVFDPFFTTKPIGKGTGLGLYICYQIVKSHGGSIDMLTGDDGTTFKIVLPLTAE
jgi:signal transduction histidine kinase